MPRKNATDVALVEDLPKLPDNQQERPEMIGWIVGFTDGEGCFSVSLIRNKTTSTGWQVFPEFVITQGEKSRSALELLQKHFKCGQLILNKRYDNHREHLIKYCVRSRRDLKEKIIPFFKKAQLLTAKRNDFEIFCKIIVLMEERKHLHLSGLKTIAKLIEQMNRRKPSSFLESSETTRRNDT